jgi:hypothetical protein
LGHGFGQIKPADILRAATLGGNGVVLTGVLQKVLDAPNPTRHKPQLPLLTTANILEFIHPQAGIIAVEFYAAIEQIDDSF